MRDDTEIRQEHRTGDLLWQAKLESDDVSSDLSGQYLRQTDFDDGTSQLFTIARVEKTHFEERNGRPEELKWVLTFSDDRALSLNKTNLGLCAKWFGEVCRRLGGTEDCRLSRRVDQHGRPSGGRSARAQTDNG